MKEATTSGGASAGANDPRQPTTARPYAPPKLSSQDLPVDYAGFLAVVFGVVGVMMHVSHHASCSRACGLPGFQHLSVYAPTFPLLRSRFSFNTRVAVGRLDPGDAAFVVLADPRVCSFAVCCVIW
jgi:hypothetical protein